VTHEKLELPLYAKASIFIIGLVALFSIFYVAKGIILPIIFAIIIAIVLHPAVNFLILIKINRVVAILITILITVMVIVSFGTLIISQVSRFSETLPVLADKFALTLNQTITEASQYFEINPQKIQDWILKAQSELINISSAAIGQTLVILGNGLVVVFLLPVYIFLILFYQPILIEFIRRLFGTSDQSQVSEIVTQVKTVIQRYLIGLVIEAAIVATLYTITLLALGVDYALLLGILGALINLIPYLGGIVGTALPMIVALATKSSPWTAVYIMIIYFVIQLIDNNFLVPKIVASKVKINALFSIIVVIAGNALWGIPGMFLSIPLLAIVKLIFDHIEPLKPWGFLLGDTMPPLIKIKTIFKKKSINSA
jgi:predicted PurR-regulated permease PerM